MVRERQRNIERGREREREREGALWEWEGLPQTSSWSSSSFSSIMRSLSASWSFKFWFAFNKTCFSSASAASFSDSKVFSSSSLLMCSSYYSRDTRRTVNRNDVRRERRRERERMGRWGLEKRDSQTASCWSVIRLFRRVSSSVCWRRWISTVAFAAASDSF